MSDLPYLLEFTHVLTTCALGGRGAQHRPLIGKMQAALPAGATLRAAAAAGVALPRAGSALRLLCCGASLAPPLRSAVAVAGAARPLSAAREAVASGPACVDAAAPAQWLGSARRCAGAVPWHLPTASSWKAHGGRRSTPREAWGLPAFALAAGGAAATAVVASDDGSTGTAAPPPAGADGDEHGVTPPSNTEAILYRYENSIRINASNEKVFKYFASVAKDGEEFMTPRDFARSFTPVGINPHKKPVSIASRPTPCAWLRTVPAICSRLAITRTCHGR